MRLAATPLLLALAGLLTAALVPSAALAQPDCIPPGGEPNASQPVCNLLPLVLLSPGTMQLGQPRVPVSLTASDHEIHGSFDSFRIVVDGVNVTSQWAVTETSSGSGTGVKKTFTSSGYLALSESQPVRTILVELCDEENCSTQTSTYTLRRPGVEVGSDGGQAVIPVSATATTNFTVTNRGLTSATFALAAECRDARGERMTPCSVSPGSTTLAAGASGTVTATFPAAQQGEVVTVLVRATQTDQPGVQDAGWTDITIQGAPGASQAAPQVTLVPMNAGATIERSQCVTVATAVRGAYECGDLRLAHALPAHRTRGRAWAPVLLYNSQHAHPRPTVYADVTMPANTAVPVWVDLVVRMQDGTVHRARFLGNTFLPGVPRRIGVQWDAPNTSTGLYKYTVEAVSQYTTATLPSSPYPGEIAIVNYAAGYFGAGWWLAGLERLHCVDCGAGGSRTLWVGGDGSTRVYEPVSPGSWSTWVAQHPDGGADTLRKVIGGYRRKVRGGGEVYFDDGGLHVRTVNRLGQTTQFAYNHEGLAAVHAPGGASWTLGWDFGPRLVRSIAATAPGAPTRTTAITIDGARRVTGITDPDSAGVAFEYVPGGNLVLRQRNRRGTYVAYAYDHLNKLESARTLMGASPNDAVDPVQRFTPAEVRGVSPDGATGSTATGIASHTAQQVHTRIDGPRTDVADVTLLYPSAAGFVSRVRDALGAETYVQHDLRFPALPTRVVSPTGQVTRAQYDFRGRPDAVTEENVFRDGRHRTTTYAYDNRWDTPRAASSYQVAGATWTLLSGTTWMDYDTITGNPLWRQQGDDPARRVTFYYYGAGAGAAAGQLRSVHAPSGVPGQIARDSLVYDAAGNLRLTVSPLGYHSLVVRDALGRDTLSVTPTTAAGATSEAGLLASGVRQRTTWDTMDRPRRTVTVGPALQHAGASGIIPLQTGAESLYVETRYDGEGLPLEVRRWADPDTAKVDTLSTSYTYDNAGRKLTETEGTSQQTYVYDQAGNVLTWTTPRGHVITSVYDVMGRMVRRVVPEVTYVRVCPSATFPCENPYPHHPNGSSGSLVIPQEWTMFRYDSAGSMVFAENADALVRRTYYANGALQSDTLSIRSLEGVDFTAHTYGVLYGYNLAGQVTAMQHPTNLTAAGQQWDQFGYHPVTGALGSMSDRRGHYFEFHHNFAGQMTSLRGPSYSDSMRYDLEGRLIKRYEDATQTEPLYNDSLVYDARGKLLRVDVGGESTYRQWYSGMGMLVGTDWENVLNAGRVQEAYGMDVLGNTAWRRSSTEPDGVLFRYAYEPGVARLGAIQSLNMGVPSTSFYPELTTRTYDPSGNADWAVFEKNSDVGAGAQAPVRDKRSRSFYGADERLRYFQERDLRVEGGNTVKLEGVWEEYRYDPLGRRVLVNTRTKDLCTSGTAFQCASATTRMVWAGDNLLWEIRRSSESPNETSGPAAAYGTVSYTHAGGIDRPLVITKGSTSILPHQNWRGQFGRGTYADGRSSDCPEANSTNCTPIPWPGHRTTAWHADVKEPDIRVWYGGLVDGMRDASGQQYKRNRYYDPATGQFTQPDPIGIAGGLNSYGFAAGDPVTYSDPYGLSACPNGYWDRNPHPLVEDCIPAIQIGVLVGSVVNGAAALGELTTTGWSLLKSGAAGAWRAIRRDPPMARLNTADPNKVHHVFGQTKHNWHKTGLDQTGNVRLIEEVGNNQRALVQSQQVRGGTVHTYQQTVNGNQVVVKVYENQQGVRSVSDAWVR